MRLPLGRIVNRLARSRVLSCSLQVAATNRPTSYSRVYSAPPFFVTRRQGVNRSSVRSTSSSSIPTWYAAAKHDRGNAKTDYHAAFCILTLSTSSAFKEGPLLLCINLDAADMLPQATRTVRSTKPHGVAACPAYYLPLQAPFPVPPASLQLWC